jgi:flagellar protein FlaI
MWGLSLTPDEVMNVKYYVYRDTVGYGKIDAMMHDLSIEDISCDGIGIPLYVFHRNPLYGQLSTNVFFPNKADLDSFVIKLAQKANRTISVAKPLVDGTLPDGSRIQITYGTDIARRGSNFSIRKFTKVPLTPIDLVDFGELSPLMLAYLWMIIENQKSILIAGGTASGKTTLLNALSLFIMPSAKIVSIEDTAELQLPHSNWVPHVARAGIGPKGYGEIEMFDLLKAALRQRPEYIIVGEVRGKEAVVMFQAMATGHPALSTIHADSIEAVIDRLTTKPIDLPVSLLQNIDVIVFLEKAKREGKFTRRCGVIMEIEGYDRSKGELVTSNSFEWKPVDDVFISKESRMLQDVASRTGQSALQVKNELLRRASLLTWMVKNRKHTFQEVSQLINLYYVDPNRLAKIMRG